MDKKTITKYMNEEKAIGYLATIDGKNPKVRPISARYSHDKILFSTFTGSDKMKQITTNSSVEMTWTLSDGGHFRIEGKAVTVSDQKLRKGFLDEYPYLKEFFKDENDKNYVLVELKPDKVKVMPTGTMAYKEIKF